MNRTGSKRLQKRRRSRPIDKQTSGQATSLQRPGNNDKEAWEEYWMQHHQPWRTEPEIDAERQKYLEERRSIKPDIKQSIYPFKDVSLSRADVEWLLATHESGGIRGPVYWNDESQHKCEGLDLRGANLHQVDLSNLPLAYLRLGVTSHERITIAHNLDAFAETDLEQANLSRAHLEGAILDGIYMEGANLNEAYLQKATLNHAYLIQATLDRAHLDKASLAWTDLEYASLQEAHLREACLENANLKHADLTDAHLEEADLSYAHLEGAILYYVHFEKAYLSSAHLARAYLSGAHLAEADLFEINLFDDKHVGPQLRGVYWGNVDLTVVRWSQVDMLQEEYEAKRMNRGNGEMRNKDQRLNDYENAVQANRQLAVALQGQGLSEAAAYFAYRAQDLQKSVLWYQLTGRRATFKRRVQALGALLFTWVLFLLAGYGYKPRRTVIAYLIVIFGFTGLYLLNAHFIAPHLTWDEALVLSVSSFHGRGFFTQNVTLGDTYARLAAAEAVIGLLIEVSFIATFTQRYFGK